MKKLHIHCHVETTGVKPGTNLSRHITNLQVTTTCQEMAPHSKTNNIQLEKTV